LSTKKVPEELMRKPSRNREKQKESDLSDLDTMNQYSYVALVCSQS